MNVSQKKEVQVSQWEQGGGVEQSCPMGKNHAVKEMVGEEKVKPKFVQFVCLRG
jgi:hypothetical protein